ncbi:MAG: hypothetical protein GY866_00620 [Proteobacteria bacterium]|nr:hypothetical protein [Pseudomonadota bacterium]
MAATDYITHPSLYMRIMEKKKYGWESDINKSEDFNPELIDRFETQLDDLDKPIAEFKFPINHEGKTFFYQQFSRTIKARKTTVEGIAGPISEVYGEGVSDITMSFVFPTAAERTVILAADMMSAMDTYYPRDWADSLERFIQFFLDLHDPYSAIWTEDGYYYTPTLEIPTATKGTKIGYKEKPSPEGYELVVVDEYARSILSIHPKDVQIFASKENPLSFGARLQADVVEDKLAVNYSPIPDDIMQLAASFTLPSIDEIPVLGPATEVLNKTIAIANALLSAMGTIYHYANYPNQVVAECVQLQCAGFSVANKLQEIANVCNL